MVAVYVNESSLGSSGLKGTDRKQEWGRVSGREPASSPLHSVDATENALDFSCLGGSEFVPPTARGSAFIHSPSPSPGERHRSPCSVPIVLWGR